jgi:hypothetical protein
MEEVVPMCLYTNPDTHDTYIKFPSKIRDKDKTTLKCIEEDGLLTSEFYSINPDFRPIPPGMELFCIKPHSFDQEYDLFNIDNNCVRLLAWNNPTPYTVPLYISTDKNNSIYMSFSENKPDETYKFITISPIHVLKEKINFSLYQGRCIPDPNGKKLGECIVDFMLTENKQPTTLNYLKDNYSNFSYLWFLIPILFVIFIVYLFRK